MKKIKEIKCKSVLGKCGFEAGSFCINPYVGCGHACVYCYARFMKRFTDHKEPWGTFVDVKTNISEVLERQLKNNNSSKSEKEIPRLTSFARNDIKPQYKNKLIFIGTVTDPYQPVEKQYKLMPKILKVLLKYQNPVEILTKSNLILRDLKLLKQFKKININFTINTLDKKWKKLVEPNSSSVEDRLRVAKKLSQSGIKVTALMGPLWPYFSDIDALFKKFKQAGIKYIFSESFNTIGGNWTEVDRILKQFYPQKLAKMRNIMFNIKKYNEFYKGAEMQIRQAVKKYKIPCTVLFGIGHKRIAKEIKP